MEFDLKTPRRVFSRMGFALLAVFAVTTILQAALSGAVSILSERGSKIASAPWVLWAVSFLPLYLAGVPVGLAILRKLPAEAPEDTPMDVFQLLRLIPMSVAIMYAGNLIGTMLSSLLSGGRAENVLMNYVFDESPLRILVIVILAPLVEEFLFRKQLIDRCRRYGERTAIVYSALTFGLFHGNLFQFFYAFGLGLIFAYVYTRTGRLRYSSLLHMFINFMGSVVAPWILSKADLEEIGQMEPSDVVMLMQDEAALRGIALFGGYALLLLGLSFAGALMLLFSWKKIQFLPAAEELPRGSKAKTVWLNGGMVLFTLFCVSIMVFSLLYQG